MRLVPDTQLLLQLQFEVLETGLRLLALSLLCKGVMCEMESLVKWSGVLGWGQHDGLRGTEPCRQPSRGGRLGSLAGGCLCTTGRGVTGRGCHGQSRSIGSFVCLVGGRTSVSTWTTFQGGLGRRRRRKSADGLISGSGPKRKRRHRRFGADRFLVPLHSASHKILYKNVTHRLSLTRRR
jgi:hypothetical protein